jgi:uncharacterized protein (DUF427 family)
VALRLRSTLDRALADLRWEPTPKRVRATLGGETVVDTTRALLVWEPRRIVPSYAVPAEDLRLELEPTSRRGNEPRAVTVAMTVEGESEGVPLIDHGSFRSHTAEGEELTIRAGGEAREGAAFRPSDPDLGGAVILDFDALDQWLEEDEPIVSHPRDPFHRVDVRRSSRHVRIERDGQMLAETERPHLLFETHLPVRFYLPLDDVDGERLRPSDRRTSCAYKGEASYWSVAVGDRVVPDLAWTYAAPLPDAVEITGLVAFFDERVDVTVDGQRRPRPTTPWSDPS